MSFGPNNAQLQTLYSDEPPPPQPPSHHLTSSSSGDPPFNSSIALTILVLFSALYFMGFFSIYIRRFSTDPPPPELTLSNNRRPPRPAVSLKYKGVDPEVIRALPVYSYYRGEEIECCAICLGEFEEKENVRIIPYCRHVFHLECIGTWLKMHVTCPVCRGTQLFGSSGRRCGGGVAAAEVCGIHEGVRRSTVENGDTCIDIGEVRLVRV